MARFGSHSAFRMLPPLYPRSAFDGLVETARARRARREQREQSGLGARNLGTSEDQREDIEAQGHGDRDVPFCDGHVVLIIVTDRKWRSQQPRATAPRTH